MGFIVPTGTGLTYADGGAAASLLQVSGSTVVAMTPPIVFGSAFGPAAGESFVDVTGFSLAVSADIDYYFCFAGRWIVDAATTGIGLAVNGPAAPTYVCHQTRISVNSAAIVDGCANGYDSGTPTTTGQVSFNSFRVEGILRNGSNAGTLILRAKVEAGSGGSYTIQASGTVVWQVI